MRLVFSAVDHFAHNTDFLKIRRSSKSIIRGVCVLDYGEDLCAHLNSRHAYEDNTPKKGRGKANKRTAEQTKGGKFSEAKYLYHIFYPNLHISLIYTYMIVFL